MYAKIENNKITDTANNLKTVFPNTSFPRPLPDEFEGWVKVTRSAPEIPAGQKIASEEVILVSGVPTIQYSYIDAPFTENQFTETLKQERDNLWRSSTITLSNGAILKVNDRTRSDVSDTYDGLMAAGLTEYAGWRAENGVYTMTLELFQESKVKALGIVSKAFTAFNTTIDTHTETPYTNLQDAVDAMTALFNEGE